MSGIWQAHHSEAPLLEENLSADVHVRRGAGFGFVTFSDPDTAERVAADKYVHINGKQVPEPEAHERPLSRAR